MSDVSITELIAEAKELTDGWSREEGDRAWRPFDQAERIRHWVASWQTPEDQAEFNADVATWENTHGHDVRLKCYPEFQCAVIESYSADVIVRLVDALERVTVPTENEREALIATLDDATRLYEGCADSGCAHHEKDETEALADVVLAHFRIPVPVEPEWEYALDATEMHGIYTIEDDFDSLEEAKDGWFPGSTVVHRVAPGPWLPVPHETGEKR